MILLSRSINQNHEKIILFENNSKEAKQISAPVRIAPWCIIKVILSLLKKYEAKSQELRKKKKNTRQVLSSRTKVCSAKFIRVACTSSVKPRIFAGRG